MVPSLLTPGEFVIRKSAVDRIGVGNLAALNAGGPIYRADGGAVNIMDSDKALKTFYGRMSTADPKFIENLYRDIFKQQGWPDSDLSSTEQ